MVDDCSTDDTIEIASEYARRFSDRVRVYTSSTRAGPCRRRNDALAHAYGSLIAWLDADDVWAPTKLERQIRRFDDERVGFVYSDWVEIDARSAPIPQVWPHLLVEEDLLAPLFVEGCFICSSSVVFRLNALERRGGKLRESDFSFGDDYYLWLQLSLDWLAACERDALVSYRRHGRNESRRRSDVNFHLRRLDLLREFVTTHPEAKAKLRRARRAGLARHYLKAARFEHERGSYARALAAVARGVALDPRASARIVRDVRRSRSPQVTAAIT